MPVCGKMFLILLHLLSETLAADNAATHDLPCDDFYAYACSEYNNQKVFSISSKYNNLQSYANDQYNREIIKLLGKFSQRQHQIGENCYFMIEQVRNYFESCRTLFQRNLTRYLEELRPAPALDWPVWANENENKQETSKWPHDKDFDVFHLLGRLRALGINNAILASYDRNRNIEKLSLAVQPISSYFSTLPKAQVILTMLTYIGVKNSTKILQDILETDKLLLELSAAKRETELQNVASSLEHLAKRYPNLNFQAYFVEYLGTQLPLNTTTVVVYNPPFFQELNDKMWLLFDKAKLCSYLMIHYLIIFDSTTELNNILCVRELRQMFNLALDFLYYHYNKDHQEENVKPDVAKILQTIIDVLLKHMEGHELELTIYQIEALRQKLAGIRLNVGNLPANINCETIESLYASVPSLDENNYHKNHLQHYRFVQRERLKAHSRLILYPYETTNPPAVIYSRDQQLIALSYAYLVPPVYNFNGDFGKYSFLGLILAHKLVQHCNFEQLNDEQKSGVSRPLQAALECLKIDQTYGSIAAHQVEDNVASEVIRKIVTLKFFNVQPLVAVPAWKKYFFFHVAQHYCTYWNDGESERLNRIAMNSVEFAQYFNCPKGSDMNPTKKCHI